MSEDSLYQRAGTKSSTARRNCCRLCLAPDTECISILNSYAADKEPLITKIQHCVNIKITPNDGLSTRVCYACISYLNSWQSFKNRCVASQSKQRSWLDNDNSVVRENNAGAASETQQQHQQPLPHNDDFKPQKQEQQEGENMPSSILDGITSLKKRKSLTVYSLPAVKIKDEPVDLDEEYPSAARPMDESDEMVDPTLFLERTEEEGDEPYMDPSAYDFQAGGSLAEKSLPADTSLTVAETKEASCRACNLKFSTRANARRHERNLHPNLFELSATSANSVLVTKPTPALAAVLEMQRNAQAAAQAEAVHKIPGGTSITAQKYRQEVVNAFNKCESGFDYENPEKYRQFLTDEKITFLKQNEEFLDQYQSMTCRCCNKFYATYKNFMAHMRKKYSTLPRNLCFNCLKLNDSKALFISHLKRRNCINLFKVLHSLVGRSADFAAAVKVIALSAAEKLNVRDLLANKMYECKLCSREFRLRIEYNSHLYEVHGYSKKVEASTTHCLLCKEQLGDAADRKRHFEHTDCVLLLRCVTCEVKYETNAKFMEHVYEYHVTVPSPDAGADEPFPQHGHALSTQTSNRPVLQQANTNRRHTLAGSACLSSNEESRSSLNNSVTGASGNPKSVYFSRMPQSCSICGQQYNNYNNVLRHMESKHPNQLPQTYKCVKCSMGYPRLSNLRDHMATAHGADKTRHSGFEYIVNAESLKNAGGQAAGSANNVYTGRYDYVMKDLMSINGGITADDEDDPTMEPHAKKSRLDMQTSSGGLKECSVCNAVFNNNIGLSNHMRSHTAAAQAAAQRAASGTPNSLLLSNSSTANNNNNNNGKSPAIASASASPMASKMPITADEKAIFKKRSAQAADRRFRRMRCRLCQRRFSSKKYYRFHMLNDHQIRNVQFIKCKLCDAEFAYEKGLKVHMFKVHNTLLKDEMIVKQFECDICSIVYRTEDQLTQHKKSVHPGGMDVEGGVEDAVPGTGSSTPLTGGGDPLYWYQCKYCPSNFNTNKKLAIHINSHDEFDSNDYSCKDCGNVYSGRKSLWVHRYKKHPQFPEPSQCVLCSKVFFDSQMLENHIPTCNRKQITATGALAADSASANLYKHKTGDDDDELSHDGEVRGGAITTPALGGGELEITAIPTGTGTGNLKLPDVSCTICGMRFSDQEAFAKHIEMHERALYTDNLLADMFDTGPADPNQFYLDRVNENGEFACDLCAKSFTQVSALKVHRKWHFRGDNKQMPLGGDDLTSPANRSGAAPSLSQIPNSHLHQLGLQPVVRTANQLNQHSAHLMGSQVRTSKSQKRRRELKCEYCPSTFISNNNLRRHIYELHKDEVGNLPEPPKIGPEVYLRCTRCDQQFATKREWIEHKVADARVTKPFGPFQWGCDLCGAYVSRKEKLINHIQNHMKEQEIVPYDEQSNKTQPSNKSQHRMLQQQQQQQQQQLHHQQQQKPKLTVKSAEQLRTAAAVKDEGSSGNEYDLDEDEEGQDNDVVMNVNENANHGARNGHDSSNDDDADEDDDEEDELDEEPEDEDVDDEEEDGEEENTLEYKSKGSLKAASNSAASDEDDDDEEVEEEEEEEEDDDGEEEEEEDDAASRSMNEVSRGAAANGRDEDDDEDDDEEEEEYDVDDGEGEEEVERVTANGNGSSSSSAEDNAEDDDDDVDDEADEVDVDDDDADEQYAVAEDDRSKKRKRSAEPEPSYPCDLCRLFFGSQQELQTHVKMHFLNGPGSVSLTEMKTKGKSRSSSGSDALTVTSSS